MDRPLVALELISRHASAVHVRSGQVERDTSWNLEIVPDRAPVRTPELVAGDLALDTARVNSADLAGAHIDVPDAIEQMPGSLVTEHEQRRIGRRELHVTQPRIFLVNRS